MTFYWRHSFVFNAQGNWREQGENSNKEFVILSCLNFSFDLNKRNVRGPYANINETDNFKHFLVCARTATRDVTLRIGFLFRLAREKKVNITGKQLPYQKRKIASGKSAHAYDMRIWWPANNFISCDGALLCMGSLHTHTHRLGFKDD